MNTSPKLQNFEILQKHFLYAKKNGLSIHPFKPNDAYFYIDLKRISWKETLQASPNPHLNLPQTHIDQICDKYLTVQRAKEIEADLEIQEDFKHPFVLYRLGQPIGVLLLNIWNSNSDSSQEGQILELDILPEYRGYGFGSYLISSGIDYLTDRGCNTIYVELFQSNYRALKFYIRHGFSNFEPGFWDAEKDVRVHTLKGVLDIKENQNLVSPTHTKLDKFAI